MKKRDEEDEDINETVIKTGNLSSRCSYNHKSIPRTELIE
jgi:hypothetical protein